MKNKDILAMEKAKIVEKMNQAIKDDDAKMFSEAPRNAHLTPWEFQGRRHQQAIGGQNYPAQQEDKGECKRNLESFHLAPLRGDEREPCQGNS